MRLLPLFVAAAALTLSACESTTAVKSQDKQASVEQNKEIAVSSINIFEIHHNGRINVFYDKKTSEFIRFFVSIGGIAVLIVFIGTFQVKNFGWKCVTKDNVVSLIKGSEKVSFEEASENSSSH